MDLALGVVTVATLAVLVWNVLHPDGVPAPAPRPAGTVLALGAAVGATWRWWRPVEGLPGAWATAFGPLAGYAVALVAFGLHWRWVYPVPSALLAFLGSGLSGVAVGSAVALARDGTAFRRDQLAAAGFGTFGFVAFAVGLPNTLWWPAAFGAFPWFLLSVGCAVAAAVLGARS